MTDFIDQARVHFSYMCKSNQWDALSEASVCEWLSNFHDLKGRYFGSKILLNAIYYSEKDIIELFKYGLNEKIFAKKVISEMKKEEDYLILPSITSARIRKVRDKTLFIPLLNKGKPHESGLQFSRYLIQGLGINPVQSVFHSEIKPETLIDYKNIVIVDDCIGSGDQLFNFWDSLEMENVKQIAKNYSIEFYYLVLAGYEQTLIEMQKELKDLKVVVCEVLSDNHRVFSEKGIGNLWKDSGELAEAKAYFASLEHNRGIKMYGYNSLDFAVIFHRNIPDWSLPIFWKRTSDWNYLLPRKGSNE